MILCCPNCFSDIWLRNRLFKIGREGRCNFCGRESKYCIPPDDLEELFEPVVRLYTPIENFMPSEDQKNWEGDYIWDKLQQDWEIFALDEYESQKELVEAIFASRRAKDADSSILSSFVEIENEYWEGKDETSRKLKALWDEFCEEIKYEHRYFPTRVLDLELLRSLLEHLATGIKAERVFYRARKCKNSDKFGCSDMGKPPAEESQSNRANPKGIPYLYVASNTRTAVAEIKPPLQAGVTVGTFIANRRLKVIQLRRDLVVSPFRYSDRLGEVWRYIGFLRILGEELSRTVMPDRADIEYIPVQYLCEFIRNQGYEGVIYDSSVASGYNMAVFSDDALKCHKTELHRITKIDYRSKITP
jgi:hypothetical protein